MKLWSLCSSKSSPRRPKALVHLPPPCSVSFLGYSQRDLLLSNYHPTKTGAKMKSAFDISCSSAIIGHVSSSAKKVFGFSRPRAQLLQNFAELPSMSTVNLDTEFLLNFKAPSRSHPVSQLRYEHHGNNVLSLVLNIFQHSFYNLASCYLAYVVISSEIIFKNHI